MLAILGVSDKRRISVLGSGLLALGWSVVATDGTRSALLADGCDVGRMSDLAGIPTLLGGRVKTLTVSVMAGILARDTDADLHELAEHGITRVDLVCCNYYQLPPLDQAPALADFREKVDVGGPAMLRAAAKNCANVIPLADPDDYSDVLELLSTADGSPEGVSLSRRIGLAAKAFRVSQAYEQQVYQLFQAAADRAVG